jgi:phosphoribosyl-AMP cyclohydrolase
MALMAEKAGLKGRTTPCVQIFRLPVVGGDMDYSKLDGLIPAVVQDDQTGEVLMVGFMNQEAFDRTRATGFATFFSRTRGKLWTKGETSGNRLQVNRILVDCDDDTVLLKVTRLGEGNVCHTGTRTCFREFDQ